MSQPSTDLGGCGPARPPPPPALAVACAGPRGGVPRRWAGARPRGGRRDEAARCRAGRGSTARPSRDAVAPPHRALRRTRPRAAAGAPVSARRTTYEADARLPRPPGHARRHRPPGVSSPRGNSSNERCRRRPGRPSNPAVPTPGLSSTSNGPSASGRRWSTRFVAVGRTARKACAGRSRVTGGRRRSWSAAGSPPSAGRLQSALPRRLDDRQQRVANRLVDVRHGGSVVPRAGRRPGIPAGHERGGRRRPLRGRPRRRSHRCNPGAARRVGGSGRSETCPSSIPPPGSTW
ncbi:hypothetical protein AHOG_10475 [Actinoalloteichus hoggarensis]|uniref:Uncharacterized protein n=1 Tax=Actinoalloteichus hoggarensis TaxID=1470176 RepID=A0A221W1V2_9PSEU|nr:hypothetical protein AHOG_10475 [Actinoalloteichus hoggarensis]